MGRLSSSHKLYVDWGKVLTILTILVATTVLAILEVISGAVTTGMFWGILGYVVGNGRQAIRGENPQPMIGVHPLRRITDRDEIG